MNNDGELIDDASRHDGDKEKSKAVYEDGMSRAFQACYQALKPKGGSLSSSPINIQMRGKP